LSGLERRLLIANLLAFQNLIICGPPGVGKCRLVNALALAMTDGQRSQICTIQGHPWWAAQTGAVAHYVDLQTGFSVWRLTEFVTSALEKLKPSLLPQNDGEDGRYIVCVERMSPVEVNLYFEQFLLWLCQTQQNRNSAQRLRIIGTYDSTTCPDLGDDILRLAALVHIGGMPQQFCARQDVPRPGNQVFTHSPPDRPKNPHVLKVHFR
jgi:DNA polymerase III delta prime subunit